MPTAKNMTKLVLWQQKLEKKLFGRFLKIETRWARSASDDNVEGASAKNAEVASVCL
jgi:hypothetical protein